MEIFDKKNNLIAIIHKDINFNEGKTFYTDNEKEFQFGTFKLAKGEIIEKHIHNLQKREILKTSEAIVVLKGSLNIDLYDDDKNFIDAVTINTNDAILIFEGGALKRQAIQPLYKSKENIVFQLDSFDQFRISKNLIAFAGDSVKAQELNPLKSATAPEKEATKP